MATSGDLALHLRVRDGNADVNISGSMAPLFDAKAPEVRIVLATECLYLASIATHINSAVVSLTQGEDAPITAVVFNKGTPSFVAGSTTLKLSDISEVDQ